ncbi:BsuBI/PstI family type II restriction endonuclease [Microbacterium sp. RD1]|uniref:BsuBI/PstI family type II restriction endonuclease n=1 Tax=Microbacterium sp. RD1 TaxID=3457313 RepID=UPI003FA5B775
MDSAEQAALRQYCTPYQTLADVAWETEAWCASSPTHMIHLNGDRLLNPQQVSAS